MFVLFLVLGTLASISCSREDDSFVDDSKFNDGLIGTRSFEDDTYPDGCIVTKKDLSPGSSPALLALPVSIC